MRHHQRLPPRIDLTLSPGLRVSCRLRPVVQQLLAGFLSHHAQCSVLRTGVAASRRIAYSYCHREHASLGPLRLWPCSASLILCPRSGSPVFYHLPPGIRSRSCLLAPEGSGGFSPPQIFACSAKYPHVLRWFLSTTEAKTFIEPGTSPFRGQRPPMRPRPRAEPITARLSHAGEFRCPTQGCCHGQATAFVRTRSPYSDRVASPFECEAWSQVAKELVCFRWTEAVELLQ